jgi:hypothetical protein
MKVRPYEESDAEELRKIHSRQGFSYPFPDLRNPLFLTKLVLVDEEPGREVAADKSPGQEQKIVGAALLRLTSEAYLLLDPNVGPPKQRWQCLLSLHAAAEQDAAQRGLEDAHAWLPPEIAKKFGKRLTRLGWVRDDEWTPYCRRFA